MKRTILLCAMAGSLFAGEIETNIEATIKAASKLDVKVLETKKLEHFNQMLFARLKTPDGREIPVFTSADGKSFIGFASVLYSPSEEDNKIVKTMLETVTATNKSLEEAGAQKALEGASKVFENLPQDRYLMIKSSDPKVTKVTIVVSDPDCPYCREELKNIETRLKTTNVKMIFAPVHDDKAFVKSELIIKEGNKAKTSEDKIKLIRKYFVDMPLSPEQMKTDISKTKDNAKVLFGSGIVKGVPFLYEVK